LKIFDLLF